MDQHHPKLTAASIVGVMGGHVNKEKRNECNVPGPGHSNKDRSLSITIDPNAPGGFLCHSHAGDDDIVCKDYICKCLGIEWRKSSNGAKEPSPSKVTDEYIYRQADGSPHLRVCRTTDKKFLQARWNGKDWEWGAPKGPKIPYRLPALLSAEHDEVFIVEGEKDADNLSMLGLTTTCNSEGAGKWTDDLNCYLKDRNVYILPDNDTPGIDHARKVATALSGIAREIRIVELPDLPPKGDVSDWISKGGTVEQLDDLARAAAIFDPASVADADDNLILSSAEFLDGFVPPDYLIFGLLQRGFIYSFTGPTGSAKTAIALLWAEHVALGKPIGGYDVEQGRVLFLAGENPIDVRQRWMAMTEHHELDKTIPVFFLPGVFKLSEIGMRIKAKMDKIGPVSLVIIDTSAAYYEGDDENDNVQMGVHARRLRDMVQLLPGQPCVIVCCHPTKGATPENMLPRGGGSFVNEMDGNLTSTKTETQALVHWCGKFRGPEFTPIPFSLMTATAERLLDTKGRQIMTVMASPMSEEDSEKADATARNDEDALLLALAKIPQPPASMNHLAMMCGWRTNDGQANKGKVRRAAERLKRDKLVIIETRGLDLTPRGMKGAEKLEKAEKLKKAEKLDDAT